LKQNDEFIAMTQTFFPNIVMWSNYTHVLQVFDFVVYMRNTIVVAIFSTIGTLLTTIFAAFAFARLRFKGRDAVFAIFLMTMMIPGEMMVISNYITVASFGWIGEGQTIVQAYAAMIVPFWTSVFYIYLLRQNFKQIPNELYLAAKVDGKSDWSFLWRVMVPLAAPTLISITILKFMGTWNSYVWPNLVTNEGSFRLISNGLRGSSFVDVDSGVVEYGYQMAATVFVTVPLFLLFVFFRKYIMRGVGRAGIKG
jgi:multiple sugar transport system permease protein